MDGEEKKSAKDILEESIDSVKVAKKQETENPIEEEKVESSQEELLKFIKELKSEISDIKKANEAGDLDDDVDDDDDGDEDEDNKSDATDDEADANDGKDDADPENEKLKSEVEKLKKQLGELRNQNSSTQQGNNPKIAKLKKWTIGCLSILGVLFILFMLLPLMFYSCSEIEEVENNSGKPSVVQSGNPKETNVSNSNVELKENFSTNNLAANNEKIRKTDNVIEKVDQGSKTVYTGEETVQTGDSQENILSDNNNESEKELGVCDGTGDTDNIIPISNSTETTPGNSKGFSSSDKVILVLIGCVILYFIVCSILVCNESAVVFVGWLDYIISMICSIFIFFAILVACQAGQDQDTDAIGIWFSIFAFFMAILFLLPLYIRLNKFNTTIGALLLIPYKMVSAVLLPVMAIYACFYVLGELFRKKRDNETYSDYKSSQTIALGIGYLGYKFLKKLIRDPREFRM